MDILALVKIVHIVSPAQVASYLISKGKPWTPGQSATNQAYKLLCKIPDIERHRGFFRLKGCKSNWKTHDQRLSEVLIDILCNFDAIIFREHLISDIGLRPDAIVLLKNNNMCLVVILEVMVNEEESYIQMKRRTWEQYKDAPKLLSELFGVKVPLSGICFLPIREGESILDLIPKESL